MVPLMDSQNPNPHLMGRDWTGSKSIYLTFLKDERDVLHITKKKKKNIKIPDYHKEALAQRPLLSIFNSYYKIIFNDSLKRSSVRTERHVGSGKCKEDLSCYMLEMRGRWVSYKE